MKQLIVWIGVVIALSIIVFSGVLIRFHHFWEAWELLAAATACLYNLFFAVVVFASRREKGEGTLHEALADNGAIALHLILRVSLPAGLFFGTVMVILLDRHAGLGPVPAQSVFLKLSLTLGAFVAILAGDFVTERQLNGITNSDNRSPRHWMNYFHTRVWLIDLPFVIGYVGLIGIYAMSRFDPDVAYTAEAHALAVQAFVGGASALEMMVQSAIHGFSELSD